VSILHSRNYPPPLPAGTIGAMVDLDRAGATPAERFGLKAG